MAEYLSGETNNRDLIEYSLPSNGFKVKLTPAAFDIARQHGWRESNTLLAESLTSFLADPKGEYSIDERSASTAPVGVSVNRLSAELESLFGVPVAVKGANRDDPRRMDLPGQFALMHKLYKAQQEFYPDGIDGLFFFNQPFGLVSHPSVGEQGNSTVQHWLLMERIVDGQPVSHHAAFTGKGLMQEAVFLSEEYPDLARFVSKSSIPGFIYRRVTDMRSREVWDPADPEGIAHMHSEKGVISFPELSKAFAARLRPAGVQRADIGDTHGDNILQTTNSGRKRYTIIDPQAPQV